MTSLPRAAAKQGTERDYVRRLLAAASGIEHNGPTEQALIEPLSERELDVLRLLGSELDGPAIARELMVSLNTDEPGVITAVSTVPETWRRLPSSNRALPPPESPHQSPGMAMPAHHRRVAMERPAPSADKSKARRRRLGSLES